MNHQEFKKELLSDPEFQKEYSRPDLANDLSNILIRARLLKGLTQKKLANLLLTKQSSIARLESGNALPSLRFLEKIAGVYKTKIVPPTFEFLVNENSGTETKQSIVSSKYYQYFLDKPFDYSMASYASHVIMQQFLTT
jgi:transcriptional regulator with XRE-family HTH domain